MQDLVPCGEEDAALPSGSSGRDLVAVEVQDKALIEQHLAGREIGKARRNPEIELDLEAQIAGLLAGQRVEINPGLATGSEHLLQLTQV
ncbi:hypothetical protein [Pseudomonas entomophila]|uniref:hypothetical protein n=1 Tax=Pseudomonas entomophila TaxID=312306 RepID=UPI0035C1955E